jgi:5'-nucleotidase/UDP-sugar diphosphatase
LSAISIHPEGRSHPQDDFTGGTVKKIRFLRCAVILPVLLVFSCAARPAVTRDGGNPGQPGDGVVEITILQMNDVYELTPVSGGKEGGLARVATIRKELLAENPHTLTMMAGDLFSPSALGTANVDGERLAGRQIVAVMNVLGLDYITFGNHEFDIPENSFFHRLEESRFTWISGNVLDKRHMRFPGVPEFEVREIRGANGGTVRLGILGLTIDSNKAEYVTYKDFLEVARAQVAALRGRVDILLALTHLSVEQDISLAQDVPGIDLILGGHEHENMQYWRGPNYVPIFKADANARTVYIHRLSYDPATRKPVVRSSLLRVTGEIPEDPATQAVVRHWQDLGYAAFRAEGFQPEQVVATLPVPLDGLEASVRNRSTTLTRLIAEAMLAAVPGAELSMFNGGSVRVDDVLPPGPLTQYDVIRILPFGGNICGADIEGGLLRKVLGQGLANRGTGGFLQTAGVARDETGWRINGKPLSDGSTYKVAINDYLISGKEQGFSFFSGRNPGVRVTCVENSDIRFIFRDHLQKFYGGRP